MEQNPILVIDDDPDDLDLIKEVTAYLQLTNPLYLFHSGKDLITYMETSTMPPFLILCDVNLPGETGFDIKKNISDNPDLKYKAVPFIFWSTSASEKQIQQAYDLPAQGFFFKPTNFDGLCETFKTILSYWQKSQHPKRLG